MLTAIANSQDQSGSSSMTIIGLTATPRSALRLSWTCYSVNHGNAYFGRYPSSLTQIHWWTNFHR